VARRSDHSKEEIRELAITHACKLIAEKGDDGYNARSITKEMGYTVGTLYYLFGNMEKLRFHVCGRILDQLFNQWEAELPKNKNKLNYHIMSYIKFTQEHMYLWTFLFSFNSSSREAAPLWYREKVAKFFFLFAEAFQPYIKNKKAALTAAKTIFSSVHGICIMSLTGQLNLINTESPESLAKHLLKTYLAELKK